MSDHKRKGDRMRFMAVIWWQIWHNMDPVKCGIS